MMSFKEYTLYLYIYISVIYDNDKVYIYDCTSHFKELSRAAYRTLDEIGCSVLNQKGRSHCWWEDGLVEEAGNKEPRATKPSLGSSKYHSRRQTQMRTQHAQPVLATTYCHVHRRARDVRAAGESRVHPPLHQPLCQVILNVKQTRALLTQPGYRTLHQQRKFTIVHVKL